MEQQITIVDSVWYYWVLFVFAAIVGSIASSLTNNNGKAIMCGWEKENLKEGDGNPRKYCLGIIADILIGIAASLGILWTLTPQTVFRLIGMGTLAGYGGSSILRALTNKLEAQFSQQKANESEKKAMEFKEKATENKDEAETNKSLEEVTNGQFKKEKEKITAIKDYLLENHKEVLKELYNKKFVN